MQRSSNHSFAMTSSLLEVVRSDVSTDRQLLCSKHWAEPHFGTVELAQLGIAKENAVYVLIHLLKPNLFVTENFANENSTLVPTDVFAVVYSSSLERSGIHEARHSAGKQPCAGYVDISRRLVGECFVRALMVEHLSESVELPLL